MDDVLVIANVKTLGFDVGDSGWLARTPMVDGMIKRGYLSVLEVRPIVPEPPALEWIELPEGDYQ